MEQDWHYSTLTRTQAGTLRIFNARNIIIIISVIDWQGGSPLAVAVVLLKVCVCDCQVFLRRLLSPVLATELAALVRWHDVTQLVSLLTGHLCLSGDGHVLGDGTVLHCAANSLEDTATAGAALLPLHTLLLS